MHRLILVRRQNFLPWVFLVVGRSFNNNLVATGRRKPTAQDVGSQGTITVNARESRINLATENLQMTPAGFTEVTGKGLGLHLGFGFQMGGMRQYFFHSSKG